MFGSSNTFGQSSNNPFSCPSVFGQTNNANNNPFAPNPFGASSVPAFATWTSGTSTTPAMSAYAFGATSAPAFGSTSTHAFGTPYAQTLEGDNGSGTQPAGKFVSISAMPAYKEKNHEELRWEDYQLENKSGMGFNTTNNTQFNSFCFTPLNPFTSTTPRFGSSPFGALSAPTFGQSSSVFGTATSPFGAQNFPLGVPSNPFSTTLGFGSSPFNASSAPAFGQSTSAFGTATSTFGAQSLPFGGQTSFKSQRGGSRVTPYAQTLEGDNGSGTQPAGKFVSMSAMPAYKEKNHEELRWEDYQLENKSGIGFNTNNNTQTNSIFSTPFGASSAPAFGQSTSAFGATMSPFVAQSLPFGGPNPAFATATSPFVTTPTFGITGFGQTSVEGQRGGSRVTPYAQTPEGDYGSARKFTSISAMPIYKEKSHEELRWEDYQLQDKGGQKIESTQSNVNPFSPTTPLKPFPKKTSSSSTSASSVFGIIQGQGSNLGNTQSTTLFPSFPFGQPARTTPAFGQSNNAFEGNLNSTTPSVTPGNTGFNHTTPPRFPSPFSEVAYPTENPLLLP